MKTRIFKMTVLTICITALLSFDLPNGWVIRGSNPDDYEMGTDKGSGKHGKNSATIKSKTENIDGFGTLMQSSGAGKYLDKKVRMTGFVKSENVTGWAGLWLRVDGQDSEMPLSFDNMQDRAIIGTTGWTKYEILLDVPSNASRLAYGALLAGAGQIWFDNIKFEVVENPDVKSENKKTDKTKTENTKTENTNKNMEEPVNLDFEK